MRQDIQLHLNLSIPTRTLIFLMAAALLVTVTPELGSENVTLSTYYPAPSGVYNQMITTGRTLLATTSTASDPTSLVGIGTSNPAAKLDIVPAAGALGLQVAGPAGNTATILRISNGGLQGNFGLTQSYANWNLYGTGDGGAAIYNSNEGSYQALMIVGNSSNGGLRHVAIWDNMTIRYGSLGIGQNAHTVINPSGQPRGYLYIDNANTGCAAMTCNNAACACGGYASWTPGVFIEGTSYQNRGYPAYVDNAGYTTQVWSMGADGNARWGTLQTKPDGTGTVWCCPK